MGLLKKLRRRVRRADGPLMGGSFTSTDDLWGAAKAWVLELQKRRIPVETCFVLIGEQDAGRVYAALGLRSVLGRWLFADLPEVLARLDCSDPSDCLRVLCITENDNVDSFLFQPALGAPPAASKDASGAPIERWEHRLVEVG